MRRLPLLAAAVALLTLTGCARAVNLPPADDAANPGCANVSVSLPEQLGDASLSEPLDRRDTTAQATAAWGDPSAVTLRCGMPEPAPSTSRCITVGAVDWLEVAQEENVWTFVSYGRSPATEVVIDTSVVSAVTALEGVSGAVERLELVGACS
jgi:predicted small lipoprotein YifL